MVLHTAPFSSPLLSLLNGLSWGLVFPCYWLLDRLLASFLTTSQEKRRRSQDPCSFLALCVLVSTPLYLLLILAALPLALLGFLMWAPLQAARRPYVYSRCRADAPRAEQGGAGGGSLREWRPQGRSFCFCSANVCLLPDSLARFNNLSDTQGRAREVGRRIRNGASRPQIKIYIDSPTNTSISAASFSSLVQQGGGFRRTSSLDHRPDSNGEAEPREGGGAASGGPQGEECVPLADCSANPAGAQMQPECPLQPAGVQISISAPEPDPEEDQSGNHQAGEGDAGSLDSRTASRESLARFHGCDGGRVQQHAFSPHLRVQEARPAQAPSWRRRLRPRDLRLLPCQPGLPVPAGGVRQAGGGQAEAAAAPLLPLPPERCGPLRLEGLLLPLQVPQQRPAAGQPVPHPGRRLPVLPQRARRGCHGLQGSALCEGTGGHLSPRAEDCGIPHLHSPPCY
ncbi:hypothetical protein SKAU_G00312150 [Synaphobranchus kaupii]|uniref:Uncharacterized protein n=1 Tax=Synaphobranchus kaupii TaxID=118154 RepID=A0A9Q1IKE4_SYNKA|nr:hypothetical protein SKAU_G00312150 [Synaphobranchus kaupii]